MDKKIFCVSLVGKEQVKATAVFKDDQLVVAKLEKISGFFGAWKPKLLKEIKKNVDRGFTVIIEEQGDQFGEQGLSINLQSLCAVEKRAYMSIGFDLYFNLQRMQSVIFSKESQRHIIQESIVNIITDDRGRNHYDVNQGSFSGYHRAILLCTLAAVHVYEYNDAYLDELMSGIDIGSEEVDTTTLRAITVGRDKNEK